MAHLVNSVDLSSSSAFDFTPIIELFFQDAQMAFGIMMEARWETSREQISVLDHEKMINYFRKKVLSHAVLTEQDAKRGSWTWTNFVVRDCKQYCNADRTYPEVRDVLPKPQIWNIFVWNHNSVGHVDQDPTAKPINRIYHRTPRWEVIFFIKLCEIYHWKALSKSKNSLKNIISKEVFKKVQIDLIKMRPIPDSTFFGIFLCICYLVCHFCKIQMLIPLVNKKAAIVARFIYRWTCTFSFMKIL